MPDEDQQPLPKPQKHKITQGLTALATAMDSIRVETRQVRRHDITHIQKIARSLDQFGQQRPIVVSSEGEVKAGNGTYMAAEALGWTHVAAVVSDLHGPMLDAYGLADNKTYEASAWFEEALGERLLELQELLPFEAWEATGFDEKEAAELMKLDDAVGGDNADDGGTTEDSGLPSSAVRMVQLFLSAGTIDDFLSQVSALQKEYGAENLTETVVECVRRASSDL